MRWVVVGLSLAIAVALRRRRRRPPPLQMMSYGRSFTVEEAEDLDVGWQDGIDWLGEFRAIH